MNLQMLSARAAQTQNDLLSAFVDFHPKVALVPTTLPNLHC